VDDLQRLQLGGVGVAHPGQHVEFVRPDPRHEIGGRHRHRQSVGELDQDAIGDDVTVHLVERLEAGHVEGDQRGRRSPFLAQAAGQFRLQSVPVGQAGEGVADAGGLGVALRLGLGEQDFGEVEAAAEGIGEDAHPGGDGDRHDRRSDGGIGRFQDPHGPVQDAEAVVEAEQQRDDAEEHETLAGRGKGPLPGGSEAGFQIEHRTVSAGQTPS